MDSSFDPIYLRKDVKEIYIVWLHNSRFLNAVRKFVDLEELLNCDIFTLILVW